VPEFQPMVIPEHSPLNAEAMVKINQESTIDEIVGTADGFDIEQDIEVAEDEIEETEE
jgi:hypothetical protein